MNIPLKDSKAVRKALNDLLSENKIEKSGKYYSLNSPVPKQLYKENKQRDIKEYKENKRKLGMREKPAEKDFSKKSVFTGVFEEKKKYGVVYPDSKITKREIIIFKKNFGNAEEGDKVVCRVLNSQYLDDDYVDLEGEIIKVLGKAGDFETELESIAYKYGFRKSFPQEIVKETNYFSDYSVSKEYDSANNQSRKDLRDIVCFTIDPEDAKDYDDAVSVQKKAGGGYVVGVHIADVSHFVKEKSYIDEEALNRGTSVYFPDRVLPMLPEILSNNLCSLKPGEDRLTFSVLIDMNRNYEITGFSIHKSIIKSKRRFSYDEAQDILNTGKGDCAKEMVLLGKIAKSLQSKRMKEGSIDFDKKEIKFVFGENGIVTDIKIKERLDSMRMIEEFMLLANRCVTEFAVNLAKETGIPLPFVFRVHDDPDPEKLNTLSEFVTQFGYKVDLADKNSIKKLLETIKGKPEDFIINDLLIRSMAKAVYTDENIGHYGLGFVNYTHFTSPIRRYPDLIVHRLLYLYLGLGDMIAGGRKGKKEIPQEVKKSIINYGNTLNDLCRHCSEQEQSAVSAEREAVKLFQIQFIKDRIGDEFDAMVSGIVKYGMFVELTEYLLEGMIRFRDMEDDYYEFDEKRHLAYGRRRKKTYRAGDRLRVRLINASVETKRVDFIVIK